MVCSPGVLPAFSNGQVLAAKKPELRKKCAAFKAGADTRDIAECERRSHDMTRAAVSASAVARSLVAQRHS